MALASSPTLFACNGGDELAATGTGASYSGMSTEESGGASASESSDSASSTGTEETDETGTEETGEPGGDPGDPCDEDEDCESEICVEPSPGSGESVCAELCDPFCPDGFICVNLMTSSGSADVCVPAVDNICEPCSTNNDCGDTNDFCINLAAGDFCTQDCTGNPDICPPGFACGLITGSDAVTGMQCVPDNGICCIDGDGDVHGEGAGCLGPDCDDRDPDINPSQEELCDGVDNDCNDEIDDEPVDCAPANCQVGILGYVEEPAESCEAGSCGAPSSQLCGLYTCSEGGDNGDECAESCDVEEDLKCIPDAHCDASVCYDDFANGLVCDEDSDCASDHCENDFCCDFGGCCQVASDCPGFGTQAAVCDDPTTCQGSKGDASCSASFQCGTVDGIPDDSACEDTTLADDCGLYVDAYCTGEVDQSVPTCLSSCSTHADCDDLAFCNSQSSQCELKRPDGEVCVGDDDAWCLNDHCENGFCCATGDCCEAASDCPASYSGVPVCAIPSACQGNVDQAQCLSFICSTLNNAPDDSACVNGLEADDCASYLSVFCDGAETQVSPQCATMCSGDSDCDPEAYCDDSSACVPDEDEGEPCNDGAECLSAHCQNGFCCDSGDCCAASNDCGDYFFDGECTDAAICAGQRVDGVCGAQFQCSAEVVGDGSACDGLESDECGPYLATTCPDTSCDTSCVDDSDCDASAHCDAPDCIPDAGAGGYCDEPGDCGAGLFCVDSVCCNTACNGTCEACDLAGDEGTCLLVPDGQDPDNECGSLACAGYYWGWGPDPVLDRDKCYARADVGASAATCGGDGLCRDASESCPSQGQGAVTINCDDLCQEGNLLNCSGTNAGTCLNLNLGTETCGDGPCEVTVNRCESGVPQTCIPNSGASSPETCNDIDDNCDGTIDNGSFSDSYESNGSCGAYANIPDLGSNDSHIENGLTLYNAGDWDYYKADLIEDDSECACTGGPDVSKWFVDEDYLITVKLTVPANAGSYEFCSVSSVCEDVDYRCETVSAGQTGQLQWYKDGCCSGANGCSGADSYDLWIRVRGIGAPAFECDDYVLEYEFDAGYCI